MSSDGIATALMDSASALMEGGNNLEQATALVAAANRVVQDPNSVGSALRTISLRLRGTSVEVLEEMGEETEGAVESFSKMQSKIKALSGIDIVDMNGAYKDTYTILKEIGTVWGDMADMDQAALLELMAGKNRANTLAAILDNMEDLEGAYETAMNAEGSAIRENEAYLDSIQGKIDLFTNSLQTMWSSTLDSDMVKGFVELGTTLLDLITKFGLVKTSLVTFAAGWMLIKKQNPVLLFKDLSAQMYNYGLAMEKVKSLKALSVGTNTFDTNSVNAYAAAVSNLTAKQQASLLASQGLTREQIKEVLIKNQVSEATMEEALAQSTVVTAKQRAVSVTAGNVEALMAENGITLTSVASDYLKQHSTQEVTLEMLKEALAAEALTKEEYEAIAATLGLVGANKGLTLSFKGLGAAIKTALLTNPIGLALTAITTIATIGIPLFKELTDAQEEANEAAEETITTYENAQEELSSMKSTIDGLVDDFKRLSSGVGDQGENLSLTTDSYARYNEIANQIADLFPEMVTGWTEEGNAILSCKGNVDALTEAYEAQAQAARQAIIAGGSDVFDAFKMNYNNNPDFTFGTKTGLKQQVKLAERLKELMTDATEEEVKSFFTDLNAGNIEIDGEKYSNIEMSDLFDSTGIKKSDFYNWFKDDYDMDAFKNHLGNINTFITSSKNKIKSEALSVISVLNAYLGEDSDYKALDKKYQNLISGFVSNLDSEFLNGFDSQVDIYAWIKTNYIEPFSDPSIKKSIEDLLDVKAKLDIGEIISYGEYKKEVEAAVEGLQGKLDEDAISQIKLSLGIDEESFTQSYNHIESLLSDKFKKELGQQGSSTEEFIKSLSLEDFNIAGSLEVDPGTIESYKELKQAIKEAKYEATEDFDLTNYTSAVAAMHESIAVYEDALRKIKDGSFTIEDFMELIKDFPELAEGVDLASGSFEGLSENLIRAIESSPDDLIDELKELKYNLEQVGKSTDGIDGLIYSLEQMPTNIVEDLSVEFGTLADQMDRAAKSKNNLDMAMEEESTGYDSRSEAMEMMVDWMEKGEIGSESQLWDVAKANGFSYDSAKTINENADALMNYINVRKKWYDQDDDGNYTYAAIEDFMESIESAAGSDAFKKAMEKQGLEASDFKWSYDEDTGAFNVDFDNINWETIVKCLSETSEAAGLTSEEFYDLYSQAGKYFGIEWEDFDDQLNHLNSIANSADDAKTKISEYGKAMQDYFGKDTNIDLTDRPVVNSEKMKKAGWEIEDGSYATVDTSSYSNEDGTKTVVLTPILPDGTVLSPDELKSYADKILAGEEIDPDIKIKLAEFEGKDSVDQADKYAQKLHSVQEQYYELLDPLKVANTLQEEGLDGLNKIEKVSNSLKKDADGNIVGIDEQKLRKTLEAANYTEDAIESTIDMMKAYNAEVFNIDKFDLFDDDGSIDKGLDSLKEIKELKDSIYENKETGQTVVDTDQFSAVLQEAGYTKDEIDKLISKVKEYQEVITIKVGTDPLGLSSDNLNISDATAALDALGIKYIETIGKFGDDKMQVNISVADMYTTLSNKGWSKEKIVSYIQDLAGAEGDGVSFVVNGKTEISTEEIDAAIEKSKEIPEKEQTKYEVIGSGIKTLGDIEDYWKNIPKSKTTKYTIKKTTIEETKKKNSFWGNLFGGDDDSVSNGTAHVRGTAYAGGNWGAQETTTALVGELGPEMRVRNGRWELIGENGAEFSDVRQGDIIFNHKQTEDLLKNGYVTSRGKAYAGGKSINMTNPEIKQIDTNELSNSLNNAANAVNEFQGNVANANENIQENNEVTTRFIDGWVSKGKFEDGYHFGDVTKTAFGTVKDAAVGVNTGFGRIGEGLIDTVAYGVSSVAKAIGEDNFADKTQDFITRNLLEEFNFGEKVTALNPATQFINTVDKLLNKDDYEGASVLGYKSDSLVESAGQLAGTAALQSVGVPWYVTSGVTSFGSGVESAFNKDATYGEAAISAAITAGAEILTEKIGGVKFSGKTFSDEVIGSLTNGMSNEFVKKITEFGIGHALLGEGTEEVFSEAISKFGQLLTYEDDKTFKEMLFSKDAFDSYLGSYIGGFLLGEGSNAVKSIGAPNNINNGFISEQNNQTDMSHKTTTDKYKKAEDFGKPIEEILERKIFNGIETEYADYFTDGVGFVIKDAIRTMNEDYGQILSNGYASNATYFSNSADESKNYGGYDIGFNKDDKSPRAVMSDLLLKNPYIVEGNERRWSALVDTNVWTEDKIKDFIEKQRAIHLLQGMRQYMYDGDFEALDYYLKSPNMREDSLAKQINPELYFKDIDFYEELINNKHLSKFNEIFNSNTRQKKKQKLFEDEYDKFISNEDGLGLNDFYENPNIIHERAAALGHDGVIYLDVTDTSGKPNDQYVVFTEEQMRSVDELLDNSSLNNKSDQSNKFDALIARETVGDSYKKLLEMEDIYDNGWDEYVSKNLKQDLFAKQDADEYIEYLQEQLESKQSGIFSKFSSKNKDEIAEINEELDNAYKNKAFYEERILQWQKMQEQKPSRDEFLEPYTKRLDDEVSALSSYESKEFRGLNVDDNQILQILKDANDNVQDDLDYTLGVKLDEQELNSVRDEFAAYAKKMNEEVWNPTVDLQNYAAYTKEIEEKQQEINGLNEQIAKYTKSAEDYAGSDNFNQDIYDNMSNVINIEKEKVQTLESEIAALQSKLSSLNNTPKVNEEGETEYEVTGTGQDTVEEIETNWENVPSSKVTDYTIRKTIIEETKKKTGFFDNLFGGDDKPAQVNGTAHANGNFGAPRTETALTGELGPEMIVRDNRWFTVGDNGAEFANIKKGDIIFNHKQTEDLLNKGYITSRGKIHGQSAFASGTAYVTTDGKRVTYSVNSSGKLVKDSYSTTKSKNKNKNKKDSKDEFEEVFDWFEVKIEEINEDLDLMAAKLENAITIKGKNNILNDMIATNKSELKTLEKGYKLYNSYADDILKQKKKNKDGSYSYIIPKKYWDEVKDGKVAIEEFYGSVDEKTLEQIKNYREWAQKAADLKQQIQEVKREITELAKQKFDNISEKYDNIEGLQDSRQQHYVDMADYRESKGWINSGEYYEAAMSEENKKMKSNKNEKKRLQASLDNSVKKGHIKKYSAEWYEMVNAIHAVDSAIDENKANIEDYQNQINEIHFENFEKGLFRVSRLADETQSLIDIMSDADDFEVSPEGDVEWTDEGITKMGLYAQNMENYKKQNELYAAEIDNVNQMYKDGKISYQEYLEKLDELKNGQADSVKGYKDNKAAIEDMQKARVDAIKDGIDKEIEAYSELIDKKKEELSAEKDLYDFQKQVTEQRKSASDIERQLAALSGDNSASAMAKRKKLEAELAQAQQELNDSYYNRSVEKQQEALDSEFEQYEELREKEKEGWDKWLENVDGVFDDAVETVKNSGTTISTTLAGIATDWDLQINTHIKTPWTDAATALSTTSTELDGVIQKFQDAATAADGTAQGQIDKQKEQNQDITDEVKDKFQKGETAYATKGTQVYDAKGKKTFKTGYNVAYTVVSTDNSTGMTKVKNSKGEIRYIKTSDLNKTETDTAASLGTSSNSKDKGVVEYYKKYTGKSTSIKDALNAIGADGSYNNREKIAAANDIKDYKGTTDQNEKMLKLLKQGKLKRYAVGSKRINKNQLAWLDELGEELQIVPNGSGRLDYVKKGTGIIPADMTERLMDLAMNPQDMLDRNRPSVGVSPEVHNTEINLNIQYGDMLKIENFKGDNPDEIAKIVAKQFEKHTKDLNNALRKYVR